MSKKRPDKLSPVKSPAPGAAPKPAAQSIPKKLAPKKSDPTRYGDWEKNGRCIDF
jgi:hypothetical protein